MIWGWYTNLSKGADQGLKSRYMLQNSRQFEKKESIGTMCLLPRVGGSRFGQSKAYAPFCSFVDQLFRNVVMNFGIFLVMSL
jgi:hypothetical protein